jgi:rhamnogalacturonan endolyase
VQNNGSKGDATDRAKEEFGKWPYPWLNDSAYRSRGEISGRLLLTDGRSAAGASIFLGDNESNLSTLDQGRAYCYTATADKDGKFHMPHVRAGTYALHTWPNGGSITDVTAQLVTKDITVGQNGATKLNLLKWKTADKERKIFQLGAFDRKALGFRNGGAPYEHGLVENSPANLTFTIGSSVENDWYFAQSALGAWTIRFFVEDVEIPDTGSAAKLSVSVAGYSKGTNLRINVNSHTVKTLRSADIPSDPALYRSGTTAGEWHLFEVELQSGLVKSGWNEVVFEVTAAKVWKGFMWDSIWLSWK